MAKKCPCCGGKIYWWNFERDCYKCGRSFFKDHVSEKLVHGTVEEMKKIPLIKLLCPSCSQKNKQLFGEEAICPICNKLIIEPPFKNVVLCQTCKRLIHSHSIINVLKHDAYRQGKIEIKKFCHGCRNEANDFAALMGQDRYCPVCNQDVALFENVINIVYCDYCKSPGCKKCCSENAKQLIDSVPESVFSYIGKYEAVCMTCMEAAQHNLNSEYKRIKDALTNQCIIKNTQIKRFEVIKDFGYIDIESDHDHLFNEKYYKYELLKEAVKIGGNAVYEYKLDQNKVEKIAGWSKNDNPYYESITIWTLSGKAVLHREKSI